MAPSPAAARATAPDHPATPAGSTALPLRSRFVTRLAAIAALGLLIRLVHVLLLTRGTRGTGDAEFFHGLADLLAQGRGFVNPFGVALDGRVTPTALHPPLFPLLLGAAAKLGASSYLAQRVVVSALGTAALVVLGLLGRHVGGERVGLLAAGLGAVYAVLIGADGAVMSETLFGLLVGGALLAALGLRQRPTAVRALLLGALVGLAALTRAEGLLLLVLALPLGVAVGRTPGGLRRLGLAALAALVVIAPWAARNLAVFGSVVPLSNNDGTLLAGANCPATYSGGELGFWEFRCVSPGSARDEAAAAATERARGLRYAADHAGELPKVLAVRLLRTWDLYQPIRMTHAAEGRAPRVDQLGVAEFYVVLMLAGAGLVLLRRRRGPVGILLVPVLITVAATLLGYGIPRFRHPSELTLLVLAAVAADAISRRPRRGPARRASASRP